MGADVINGREGDSSLSEDFFFVLFLSECFLLRSPVTISPLGLLNLFFGFFFALV